ncbi:fluoride efflux transporter CrcB [Paractinoplanes toevensis]|uniref:Fluoride-specific ion channel FluC n=1 Tax=Paractinoplanes toevensis TaxID=571911 RepID=A0A919W058_9ACTN|nr:fluoride efflux transporter CrcB [Actinoplanes toevensis]GIM90917.1 putative fluoride ion transporter CrcB 2 [Actinoplanes toevensis]
MTLLLVALGAAIGAPLRYLTDRAIQRRHDSVFPWGTMTVNVLGSFVLGLVTALPSDTAVTALVGTGFCGALTTYSTFSFETLRLVRDGNRFYAAANVVVSIVAGLGAAAIGIILGAAVG